MVEGSAVCFVYSREPVYDILNYWKWWWVAGLNRPLLDHCNGFSEHRRSSRR